MVPRPTHRWTSSHHEAALDVYQRDTIVALATPRGRGAIAIVRITGVGAFAIADGLFVPARGRTPRPWSLCRGTVHDPTTKETIDDVLTVRMPGPATYTGEDVVELHTHGSPVVVERVLSIAMQLGARAAERGEFTRRAVLNGKLDLAQAEAVMELIDAPVVSAARAAWARLQGALGSRLDAIREAMLDVLADLEASVDFSDEDLPVAGNIARVDRLLWASERIDELLATYALARRERDGWRVAFTGRPNAGKSSLVNRLLGYGRMIVSPEPGTTRDCVEELVDLDGYAFLLTDTAGLRVTESTAESAAVERARLAATDADIVIAVVDGSAPLCAQDREWVDTLKGRRSITVVNKVDLPDRLATGRALLADGGRPPIDVSALTGEGCGRITEALRELVLAERGGDEHPIGIARERHRDALSRSSEHLAEAIALLRQDAGVELVAIELRDALVRLGGITETPDNEEVLDRIFETFCVGK